MAYVDIKGDLLPEETRRIHRPTCAISDCVLSLGLGTALYIAQNIEIFYNSDGDRSFDR